MAVSNSTGRKARAPKAAQPAATGEQIANSQERESVPPGSIEEPTALTGISKTAADRISGADYGAYQCHILLRRVLSELDGYASEESPTLVVRALVSRAAKLALAANTLLSYDEQPDEGMIAASIEEVFHG